MKTCLQTDSKKLCLLVKHISVCQAIILTEDSLPQCLKLKFWSQQSACPHLENKCQKLTHFRHLMPQFKMERRIFQIIPIIYNIYFDCKFYVWHSVIFYLQFFESHCILYFVCPQQKQLCVQCLVLLNHTLAVQLRDYLPTLRLYIS